MKQYSLLLYFIVGVLILSLSFTGFASTLSLTSDAKDDLRRLQGEEKEILDALFLMSQEVNELLRQELRLEEEIHDLDAAIQSLDENIRIKQEDYDNGLSVMEVILKNYQKRGPVSYLQLILSSDSVATLIDRINGIRDISRGTGRLLDRLQGEKEALESEKIKLDESLVQLNNKRSELQRSIQAKEKASLELENRLSALQDEREKYEDWLAQLESSLVDIKPVFSDTIAQLSKDIESGNLSQDLVAIKLGLDGVSGTISDESLNRDLSLKNYPAKVRILFAKDEMILEMPELQLIMKGRLEQLDDRTLGYSLNVGEFMGLTLERSAMEELFSAGLFELRFETLLGNNTIRSIRVEDGYLYMNIDMSLF